MSKVAGGVLECPGVFELVVPAGWRATGIPDQEYDLEPLDGRDIEINLSVGRPDKKARVPAAALVRHFAWHLGVPDVDALSVTVVKDRGQERAFATAVADGRVWFIGQLWFGDVNVLATANMAPGEPQLLKEGERLIASIAPRPRRWLRH